jgi:hypothetical protein
MLSERTGDKAIRERRCPENHSGQKPSLAFRAQPRPSIAVSPISDVGDERTLPLPGGAETMLTQITLAEAGRDRRNGFCVCKI